METLQVTKDNAVEAYNKGSEEQKELLRNLYGHQHFYRDPKDWVKTMADVYRAAGVSVAGIFNIEEREKLIMQVFNKRPDGTIWKADFSNPNQKKWRIIVQAIPLPRGFRLAFNGSVYAYDCALLGCRLYLKDQETADHIGKYLLPELQDGITY